MAIMLWVRGDTGSRLATQGAKYHMCDDTQLLTLPFWTRHAEASSRTLHERMLTWHLCTDYRCYTCFKFNQLTWREKKLPTIQMKLRIHLCKTLPFCTNHTHAHTGNTNTRPINSAACTRPSHLSYKQMQAHWCISFHHNYWINNNHISNQEQAYVITQEWYSAGLLLAKDWQVYIYTFKE